MDRRQRIYYPSEFLRWLLDRGFVEEPTKANEAFRVLHPERGRIIAYRYKGDGVRMGYDQKLGIALHEDFGGGRPFYYPPKGYEPVSNKEPAR